MTWKHEHVILFEHMDGRYSEFPCDEHGVPQLTPMAQLYYDDYDRRRDSFRRVSVQKREWQEEPRHRRKPRCR